MERTASAVRRGGKALHMQMSLPGYQPYQAPLLPTAFAPQVGKVIAHSVLEWDRGMLGCSRDESKNERSSTSHRSERQALNMLDNWTANKATFLETSMEVCKTRTFFHAQPFRSAGNLLLANVCLACESEL